jgi:hypothetical protein
MIARCLSANGTGQEEAVVANDNASRTRVRGGSLCDAVLLNVHGKERKRRGLDGILSCHPRSLKGLSAMALSFCRNCIATRALLCPIISSPCSSPRVTRNSAPALKSVPHFRLQSPASPSKTDSLAPQASRTVRHIARS